MSTVVATRSGPPPRAILPLTRWVVPISCGVAVAARIPFLARPLGPDEGGFLLVGQQWHADTSLYGSYWVDRPPVLVTIFGWAAKLGGVVPLRLFGCIAVVLVVALSADLARRVAGPRAGRWAAVASAAFLVNPLLGGTYVNGELLAAPCVLAGLCALVAALTTTDRRRAAVLAAGAGSSAVVAILIKQNMADVGVFAVVAGLLAWHRGEVFRERLGAMLSAGVAGVAGTCVVVAAWTVAHGTSLVGVYRAMYPFRFDASRVMATYGRGGNASDRSHVLLLATVLSGLVIVAAVVCWAAVTRRVGGTVVWALIAVMAFDIGSIVLGGNYWLHYLVQLIGVVAVLAGVLAASSHIGARPMVSAIALVAAITWGVNLTTTATEHRPEIGSAIKAVAHPDDTIVVAYGNPEVVQTSGLTSPYPYLWSLPVKTLDPHLDLLDRTLEGRSAPTWIVLWRHVSSWGLDSARTRLLIHRDYSPVARACGHTVYLRDGVDRPVPPIAACVADSSAELIP